MLYIDCMVKRTKHNAPAVAKAIGRTIHAHRKARNLTQEDVADAADVDRGYLQKIEKGTFQPTVAVFIDLAKALDRSPDALLAQILDDIADTAQG
jgi:transcriptional regulator with XRE-family HTH domain